MSKFNDLFIRTCIILFCLVIFTFWVIMAGPNAVDSGPVGIAVFLLLSLALILLIINVVVLTIKPKRSK